ncbi:uncharacterized protein LOC130449565 isoform X1 [Diorhabda sublineata]|uniref:uncharacterized protein LOC130449565 isoform X1 n=2 Tax=Diorhabda sublineata TaxID=1163346 RepID=UPI0024E13D68|nr:uncharacterized protein LOC130449565 isoform X1 [Diorhabda sublineata]
MMQITEDTPPDMLAGAMDLLVHLPTGRKVKMSVERSTPMMDLLVQITTTHQLQLSNYTLQALEMAPSSKQTDKILPYKPNTPIGTLDTQHIKVVPKTRTIPVPKNVPPGQQPFESTFRLKVHLPRNQLYVARVSRNVLLEDIMKRVCEEKNLDPLKYEFKHPGNLDQTLDPKLTLSDYQITEINVVSKGTHSLSQAFSSSDIMALRKEEERKQMHNKTGGGVFNLIFRRGKSSMGSGSISSDTRSISPTHSDDSRSVTPPAIVQQPILPPPKQDPPPERPKPPQRKRRPAPKPPQQQKPPSGEEECIVNENSLDSRRNSEEKPPSTISEVSELQSKKPESGLMICHSRNSSDSSGYHEASVLSENCNTSLPRRPKSAFVGSGDMEKLSKMRSQSTTNLSKMASHSKSTTSLGMTGRKKKAAPPPPPAVRASNPSINLEPASPVVASQSTTPTEATPDASLDTLVAPNLPKPLPRCKTKAPPVPLPRTEITTSKKIETINEDVEDKFDKLPKVPKIDNNNVIEEVIKEVIFPKEETKPDIEENSNEDINNDIIKTVQDIDEKGLTTIPYHEDYSIKDKTVDNNNNKRDKIDEIIEDKPKLAYSKLIELQKASHETVFSSSAFKVSENIVKKEETDVENVNARIKNSEIEINDEIKDTKRLEIETEPNSKAIIEYKKRKDNEVKKLPPEIIAVIPKTPNENKSPQSNKYDSFGKRRFQKLQSLTDSFDDDANANKFGSVSSGTSISSALATFNFVDDFLDLDDKVFSGSISAKNVSLKDEVFSELYGIHNLEDIKIGNNQSISSLRSLRSLPGFYNTNNGLKKWNNYEELDAISLASQGPNSRWVIGDSEPESLASHQALDSLASITSCSSNILTDAKDDNKPFGSTDSGIAPETSEKLSEIDDFHPITPPPPPVFSDKPTENEEVESRLELEPEKVTKIDEEERIPFPAIVEEEKRLIKPIVEQDKEVLDEIDWQYQLPSPPKAFRDSSPLRNEEISSESQSVTDFKDSVVTSPELFEKLKSIEDAQSVSTFVGDEPPLNTLSLENLEKRKTLVYNRELSTSLKMNEEDAFSNSLNKFESTYMEVQKSSQKEVREHKYVPKTTNTLPNFKISTYDRPKQKIKVFEDDTIRSNTEYINKTKENNVERFSSNLNRSYITTSMDNIAIRRNFNNHTEETFSKPDRFNSNYAPVSSVFRSESFSTENTWSTTKPVSRSKSFLTLNGNAKFRPERKFSGDETMERSNSLYDVSGLQSLGVMRLIQNKLNTPTASLENLHVPEHNRTKPNPPKEISQPKLSHSESIQKTTTEKIYKYQGPPAINMGTWSDRPKVPVSVKEDEDYKLGNNISSKLIVNTTNNDMSSSNSIEIKNNKKPEHPNEPNISIKVNGTEVPNTSAENKTGNVVIKIAPNNSHPTHKTMDNQRFYDHTTPMGYRKPFTDINKTQRPYSIAFSSEYDISRVPVVRSVELKKPYRDFGNTSVTQINQEPIIETKQQNGFLEDKKPALKSRVFNSNGAPVVRGFKPLPKDNFEPNSQVPFSQVTLRRTKSNVLDEKSNETEVKPPPPPVMPKVILKKSTINKPVEPVLDPREQLLSAIRSFGGKKGLKSVKV